MEQVRLVSARIAATLSFDGHGGPTLERFDCKRQESDSLVLAKFRSSEFHVLIPGSPPHVRELQRGCHGDVKSSLATAFQVGTKMWPVLDRSPRIRFRCSLKGARGAAVVAFKFNIPSSAVTGDPATIPSASKNVVPKDVQIARRTYWAPTSRREQREANAVFDGSLELSCK